MYNVVETKDLRINFLAPEVEYEFCNFDDSGFFVDKIKSKTVNATFDGVSYS